MTTASLQPGEERDSNENEENEFVEFLNYYNRVKEWFLRAVIEIES